MQCVDCKDLYIHYPISAMHTSFGRRLIPSKYTYPICDYSFTPSQSINKEKPDTFKFNLYRTLQSESITLVITLSS